MAESTLEVIMGSRPWMAGTALAVVLLASGVVAVQDQHADMNQRGAMVMGFDQEKTTHRSSDHGPQDRRRARRQEALTRALLR